MDLNFPLSLEQQEHYAQWKVRCDAFNQCHRERWRLIKTHILDSLHTIPLEECVTSFAVYGSPALQAVANAFTQEKITLQYQESADETLNTIRVKWIQQRKHLDQHVDDIERELDIVCNELESLRKIQQQQHDERATPLIQEWIKKYGDVEHSPLYTDYTSKPTLWPIESAKHAIEMLVLKWKYNIRFEDIKDICKRNHRSVQLRKRLEELQQQMRALQTQMHLLSLQETTELEHIQQRLVQPVDLHQATSDFYEGTTAILMNMNVDLPIRVGTVEIPSLSVEDHRTWERLTQERAAIDNELANIFQRWYPKS